MTRDQSGNQALIVGCGDVGQGLASRDGADYRGLVRSQASAERLRALGITPLVADLDHPTDLQLPGQISQIYYFAPPPPEGTRDGRLEEFLSVLKQGHPQVRILYISTTGVYGDCKGEWIDETHAINPQVDRAKRRWDAEQQLSRFQSETGSELVILRVAGIYGPDKLPLARLRKRLPMVSEQDSPWTNRIHLHDLVTICKTAMQHADNGEIFNVSDGQPDKMAHYFNAVADMAHLERPPCISLDTVSDQLSSGLLSYLAESRRLSNKKVIGLLEQQGLKLKYPDLESGLRACFSDPSTADG